MKSATPKRGGSTTTATTAAAGSTAPVLPESEETKYRQKCKDLKRRIREIEDYNEATSLSISRTKRAIQRLRLERSLILEKLEDKTSLQVDDSEGTPSPPSTPQPKPAEAAAKDLQQQGFDTPLGFDSPEKRETPTAGEKPVKTKKTSQPRDPNLPKRPQNAYIIFCDLEKERVKSDLEKNQPGESFDLTRAMAEAWKELSEEERKRFYEKYEDDKERYVREMAAYSSPNPSISEQKERKRAARVLRKLEQERGRPLEDIDLGVDLKDEPKEEEPKEEDGDDHHHSDHEDNTNSNANDIANSNETNNDEGGENVSAEKDDEDVSMTEVTDDRTEQRQEEKEHRPPPLKEEEEEEEQTIEANSEPQEHNSPSPQIEEPESHATSEPVKDEEKEFEDNNS